MQQHYSELQKKGQESWKLFLYRVNAAYMEPPIIAKLPAVVKREYFWNSKFSERKKQWFSLKNCLIDRKQIGMDVLTENRPRFSWNFIPERKENEEYSFSLLSSSLLLRLALVALRTPILLRWFGFNFADMWYQTNSIFIKFDTFSSSFLTLDSLQERLH